ncbi:MAG TPA: carbamoyl-phosphate synthase large subunit, partial [Geobacterales bacterium]|nr:carbamoyl-phosphate synthase large subunit [Geobacterales bacterium]
VKQIDTLAAEWPASTNYLYLTYNASHDDLDFSSPKKNKVIILGGGPYRIGSSVEFDWGTVNMVWASKRLGTEEVIVINCNPETVSTDYDISDKLYFEELTLERVLDIYEKEMPLGIIACVGGQTSNNLIPKLAKQGVKLLGTSYESIETAENRKKFSELLDSLGIKQPAWNDFTNLNDILNFAQKVGYPVIVRPSFVLSGAAMEVAWTPTQLKKYLERATKVSPEYPVTVSKFILNAKEVEVDAVSDGSKVIIGAIIEHIENAGVHSGDATMVIPPITLSIEIQDKIAEITNKIAKSLNIIGPFNIQFIVKDEEVYVIECNLRSSRSMPYVSKFTGVNLIELAAEAIFKGRIGHEIKPVYTGYAVKMPQFSFMQLDKADPVLSVEMRSTGEVACFGETFYEALIKAMEAAGLRVPQNGNVLLSVGGTELKHQLLPIAQKLANLGFRLFATEHTAEFLRERGVEVEVLYKIKEEYRKPNIKDFLKEGKIDLVINIPYSITLEKYSEMLEDDYVIRRKAVELNIPVITRIETASALVDALEYIRAKESAITINERRD